MTKTIEIKQKIDFYEGLNFLSNDLFGKGFNNAFQIMKGLFEKRKRRNVEDFKKNYMLGLV